MKNIAAHWSRELHKVRATPTAILATLQRADSEAIGYTEEGPNHRWTFQDGSELVFHGRDGSWSTAAPPSPANPTPTFSRLMGRILS